MWAAGAVFCLGLELGCAAPERPTERSDAPAAGLSDPAPVASGSPLSALPALEELPASPSFAGTLEFPFLPGEPAGASVSIGDTTHGRVVQSKELLESDRLKILPRQKERDLRYGTDGLIGAIGFASQRLYEKTHTPLWVGNVGRRDGGDIEWSVSHNAGRDADLAFAYKDPVSGKPVDPPDLVPVGRDGLSADRKLAFDAARTWIVVRALLEYDGASLQYLFVSEPLKKRLLEHAKASGEPAKLIDQAAEVLRQPVGAAPHDDHLHVRVYCSALDVAGGCVDFGMVHPYARVHDGERGKARQRALAALGDASPEVRRRALLRLGLIGERGDVETAQRFVRDAAPEVRVAAVELTAALGAEPDVGGLAHRFSEETDPAVLAALIDAIGRLGGPAAGPFLRDLMLACDSAPISADKLAGAFSTGFEVPSEGACEAHLLFAPRPIAARPLDRGGLLVMAARAARFADRVEPIEPLIRLVDPARPELAGVALESLSFVTNQRLWQDRDPRPLEKRLTEAHERYARLSTTLGKAGRESWLINGFGSRGYSVRSLDRRSAWELVRALADEPHLAYNARATLARLLDQPRAVVHFGPGDACRHLYGLLWEHRRDLHLEAPNDAQRAACGAAREKEKDRLRED